MHNVLNFIKTTFVCLQVAIMEEWTEEATLAETTTILIVATTGGKIRF